MKIEQKTMGWGITAGDGSEIWDSEPVIKKTYNTWQKNIILFLYPKKWFLYRYIEKIGSGRSSQFSVLDVGCGTGASMIDMKRLWGKQVQVYGVDVVQLQIDLAKKKFVDQNVQAEALWYDGQQVPFSSETLDAIYTSDVLGHVQHVPDWLAELHRVLKPGGRLAMFTESQLGKHAFIRRYLLKRGLNVDPHAPYHISLYSKQELQKLLKSAGFEIEHMYGSFWSAFFVHPDEMYPALQAQNKFPFLKNINRWLFVWKKKTHPFSTALGELFGLAEMLLIGRWIESQGYVILAKKK